MYVYFCHPQRTLFYRLVEQPYPDFDEQLIRRCQTLTGKALILLYCDQAAYDRWRALNVKGMARHLTEFCTVQ